MGYQFIGIFIGIYIYGSIFIPTVSLNIGLKQDFSMDVLVKDGHPFGVSLFVTVLKS